MTPSWTCSKYAYIGHIPGAPLRGPRIPSVSVPRHVKALAKRLLTISGKSVCVQFNVSDSENDLIVQHGELMTFGRIILRRGEPSNCYGNSAQLYLKNSSKYEFWIGYGYTEDDLMWRGHAWLRDRRGNVVETTVARQMYFGFDLSVNRDMARGVAVKFV